MVARAAWMVAAAAAAVTSVMAAEGSRTCLHSLRNGPSKSAHASGELVSYLLLATYCLLLTTDY